MISKYAGLMDYADKIPYSFEIFAGYVDASSSDCNAGFVAISGV